MDGNGGMSTDTIILDSTTCYHQFDTVALDELSAAYTKVKQHAANVLPYGTRYEVRCCVNRDYAGYDIGWYSWPAYFAVVDSWDEFDFDNAHGLEAYFVPEIGVYCIGRSHVE